MHLCFSLFVALYLIDLASCSTATGTRCPGAPTCARDDLCLLAFNLSQNPRAKSYLTPHPVKDLGKLHTHTPSATMPRRKTLASLKDTEGPSPASTISPLQPPTLDEEQRTNIREYLDHTDKPFQIVTRPLSQKRKREAEPAHEQINSFDPRLSVHYEVKPGPTWDSLRRYKKFTVVSESIAVGECVLVAHGSLDTSKPNEIDVSEQWKAQVLDVRALDSEHVYVRVAWLNRPEDLESGRRPYHGKNELIPTNELDIIDAGSVNGRIDFVKWKEEEDDAEKMDEDQYFWRQTYDAATTRTFSVSVWSCILLYSADDRM